MKTGYAWMSAGRMRAVAMTPDLAETGDRIAIPEKLALRLLAGHENMSAWRIAKNGNLMSLNDPLMWAVDEAEPLRVVTQDDMGAAIRLHLRVGAMTHRVHVTLESDGGWLSKLPDDVFTIVGTVEDMPVFEGVATLADLTKGIEWPVASTVPVSDMTLWAPNFENVDVFRTEDGDDLPIRTDVLPLLMLADRITELPDEGCLLIVRKRRSLSVSAHAGGGRRYASPPPLLPIVITAAGDPTMILHGEKVATADLLAGKTFTIKLPAAVARGDVDVLVGRLFEHVRLLG